MRLVAGQAAPDFDIQDWSGKRHQLSDYQGRKLWLAFFRYASCPLCNLRVREMMNVWEQLQASSGFTLLAIFQSPNESIQEYVGSQSPPFPLIGDPSERLYATYGLKASMRAFLSPRNAPILAKAAKEGFRPGRMEGTKTRIPADFLIDEAGRLATCFYGAAIGDHIPLTQVEAWI